MVDITGTERFLEIQYDEENGWLYLNWKGYQTDDTVKQGINKLIDLLVEYKVGKVLNDNSNTLGIWLGVAGWLVFDALPRARDAGMTSFAHVFGVSRFSKVSAEAALRLLNSTTQDIKTFNDVEAAKEWLRSRT